MTVHLHTVPVRIDQSLIRQRVLTVATERVGQDRVGLHGRACVSPVKVTPPPVEGLYTLASIPTTDTLGLWIATDGVRKDTATVHILYTSRGKEEVLHGIVPLGVWITRHEPVRTGRGGNIKVLIVIGVGDKVVTRVVGRVDRKGPGLFLLTIPEHTHAVRTDVPDPTETEIGPSHPQLV